MFSKSGKRGYFGNMSLDCSGYVRQCYVIAGESTQRIFYSERAFPLSRESRNRGYFSNRLLDCSGYARESCIISEDLI